MKKICYTASILLMMTMAMVSFIYYNNLLSEDIYNRDGSISPIKIGAGIPVTINTFIRSPSEEYTISWINIDDAYAPLVSGPQGRSHILPQRYKTLDDVRLMWNNENKIILQGPGKTTVVYEITENDQLSEVKFEPTRQP